MLWSYDAHRFFDAARRPGDVAIESAVEEVPREVDAPGRLGSLASALPSALSDRRARRRASPRRRGRPPRCRTRPAPRGRPSALSDRRARRRASPRRRASQPRSRTGSPNLDRGLLTAGRASLSQGGTESRRDAGWRHGVPVAPMVKGSILLYKDGARALDLQGGRRAAIRNFRQLGVTKFTDWSRKKRHSTRQRN